MATYVGGGHAVADILIEGGGAPAVRSCVMLGPTLMASTDTLTIPATDDITAFEGVSGGALDRSWTGVVEAAADTAHRSGRVRGGCAGPINDPAGGRTSIGNVPVPFALAWATDIRCPSPD